MEIRKARFSYNSDTKLIKNLLQNIDFLLDSLLSGQSISIQDIEYISVLYRNQLARLQEQMKVSHTKDMVQKLLNTLNELNFSSVVSSEYTDKVFGVVGWQVQALKRKG